MSLTKDGSLWTKGLLKVVVDEVRQAFSGMAIR